MAGVKINDAELIAQVDSGVSIPCQSQNGTGAERMTAEQLRQYTADNTAVSDLQGASDYATQTDLQGKQDTLTPGANITIDADNEISATVPTKTSQLQNDSGYLTTETDPVFSDSPAAGITSQDITDWNNKSDFSGDYDDLRDKPNLATVATSGDYNDLNNLPTIPAAQVQADWDEADNTAADYIKNKPTIPDVSGKADKVSSATNGDLAELDADGNLTDSGITATSVSGAVADAHTHSNKALLDMLPSSLGTAGQAIVVNSGATGLEFATVGGGSATDVQINGISITSGGVANIQTETAYNDSTNKIATFKDVHPTTGSSQPVGGMLPNVLYKLGTLSGSVSISLASPSDNTICNHYYFTFDTDSTAPTITWDAAITSWNGGSAPTITASKHFEISVLDGVATFMEV